MVMDPPSCINWGRN